MLRVMLVDDEPMALEGLELLIDWRTEGFEICASCNGGVAALAELDAARPDLIVTDIRMPQVDGLELMRLAKERGYTGQFVVVSGYGEFNYAQQALLLGVAGYLLKPLDSSETVDVLEHVRRKLIGREFGEEWRIAPYHSRLTALLAGEDVDAGDFPEGGGWRLYTWGAPLPYEVISAIAAELPSATVHIVEDKEWLVLHTPAEPQLNALTAMLAQNRRELLSAPATNDVCELASLRAAFSAELDACGDELACRVQALTEAVALRDEPAFLDLADELSAFCAARGNDFHARARLLFMAGCARLFEERSDALTELLRAQGADVPALGRLTMRLLTPMRERISEHVIAHVEAHFAECVTLDSVAAALGYNPTYLGRVFREEQAQGFREWLNAYRLDKAAALLRSTDTPVHRIAAAVGYLQYKRFLAHFKEC
ncbi:MAG: response regulator, partial [Clostridia bacterium]